MDNNADFVNAGRRRFASTVVATLTIGQVMLMPEMITKCIISSNIVEWAMVIAYGVVLLTEIVHMIIIRRAVQPIDPATLDTLHRIEVWMMITCNICNVVLMFGGMYSSFVFGLLSTVFGLSHFCRLYPEFLWSSD